MYALAGGFWEGDQFWAEVPLLEPGGVLESLRVLEAGLAGSQEFEEGAAEAAAEEAARRPRIRARARGLELELEAEGLEEVDRHRLIRPEREVLEPGVARLGLPR